MQIKTAKWIGIICLIDLCEKSGQVQATAAQTKGVHTHDWTEPELPGVEIWCCQELGKSWCVVNYEPLIVNENWETDSFANQNGQMDRNNIPDRAKAQTRTQNPKVPRPPRKTLKSRTWCILGRRADPKKCRLLAAGLRHLGLGTWRPAILEYRLLAAGLRYLGWHPAILEYRLLAAGLRYLGWHSAILESKLLAAGLRYLGWHSDFLISKGITIEAK